MSRVQLTNPAEVPDLFRRQFELCNVQQGETIVVLSDLGTRNEYVEAAFAAAKSLKADILMKEMSHMKSPVSVYVRSLLLSVTISILRTAYRVSSMPVAISIRLTGPISLSERADPLGWIFKKFYRNSDIFRPLFGPLGEFERTGLANRFYCSFGIA